MNIFTSSTSLHPPPPTPQPAQLRPAPAPAAPPATVMGGQYKPPVSTGQIAPPAPGLVGDKRPRPDGGEVGAPGSGGEVSGVMERGALEDRIRRHCASTQPPQPTSEQVRRQRARDRRFRDRIRESR